MTFDQSLWGYFINASPIVKLVMLGLLAASIGSWTLIFSKYKILTGTRKYLAKFEDKFWSGINLNDLFLSLRARSDELTGIDLIFYTGFNAFLSDASHNKQNPEPAIVAARRAMRVSISREADRLEQSLPILASIGSTSPYIGLFGTVWGIMTAFHALGNVQQATIAMVAPGISEALLATAMGLFAAIPAVLAYNRYTDNKERLLSAMDAFAEEFAALLQNKTQAILAATTKMHQGG